ncbi:MAG: DUF503 domain-containing protein [Chloroflexi bacterium]|nr:DUF503 domain-containing protein [Chloroflexota bacterium]
MVVGTARVHLHLPEGHSLKEKRHIVKSLIARTKNQFNVSIAEVGDQDLWQSAVLGIACVSNDPRHADEMVSGVVRFLQNQPGEFEMTGYETEIVHVF